MQKKQVPLDKYAQLGPPDKTSHFKTGSDQDRVGKGIKRQQIDCTSSSSKKSCPVTPEPNMSLMFKTCKVLYDDGVWYTGRIIGLELKDRSEWMYKVNFSDGETTLVSLNDAEVSFLE